MTGNISAKNTKLGRLIHAWSVTAGESCPGETQLCAARCYAKRGHFHQTTTKRSHANNLAFSKLDAFVPWMKAKILADGVNVLRVHVAGDFYDLDYIAKWYDICHHHRRVKFFAYTRSWRIEALFPGLVQLGALPNFSMWWSIDRATGMAPAVRGIRQAYMAINDADAEAAPADCDLVFRDQRPNTKRTVMKKASGVLVCPPENGVHTKTKITCSRCGICWNTGTPAWESILGDYLLTEDAELTAPEVTNVEFPSTQGRPFLNTASATCDGGFPETYTIAIK